MVVFPIPGSGSTFSKATQASEETTPIHATSGVKTPTNEESQRGKKKKIEKCKRHSLMKSTLHYKVNQYATYATYATRPEYFFFICSILSVLCLDSSNRL